MIYFSLKYIQIIGIINNPEMKIVRVVPNESTNNPAMIKAEISPTETNIDLIEPIVALCFDGM